MNFIDTLKRVTKRRSPKVLTVRSAFDLTPNMRRVTLGGDDVKLLPEDSEGAYIKLVFEGETEERPRMRTYTIARHRPEQMEIDVDFMLHFDQGGANDGLAAPWSVNTRAGDLMPIFGPGPAKTVNHDADWFLMAADMTALPALSVNLAALPDDAKGTAFVEILSTDDQQTLSKPENVDIQWVVNSEPGSEASPLFHAVSSARWLDGQVACWVACEFKTMRKIRQYLKSDRGVTKSHIYISSYWKKGNSEEQHKAVKQADLESEGS
ncbi:MAG: siderophore-interacting protein [Pseudomonadota bacterium]